MAILAVWALLLTAPVSVTPVTSGAALGPVTAPAVIIKLGNASLEEYQGGDSASRVQLTQSN